MFKLNNQLHNPTNNFLPKNCLLGIVKLMRNGIKSTFTYNSRGRAFDGEGSLNFDKDLPRNAVIFRVDNSSSSHTGNPKNYFLVFDEKTNRWYWR